MAQMDYDVVVIGSGFGGSVCAMRAAESGMRVCVLERGARLTPGLREEMAEGRRAILHERGGTGIVEKARVRGLMAVVGSAVGGGSQLYTAVTIPAGDEVFTEGWPSGMSAAAMRPYYERVNEVIAPTVVPTELARTRALEGAGRSMGAAVTRLPVAIDWPADAKALQVTPGPLPIRREAMTWLGGGVATRKRTLDKTYLARAEAVQGEVRELHEATGIAPLEDGYEVQFIKLDGSRREGTVRARRVVLAAGTLGTLRLLFECRDMAKTLPRVSGALGERFFTNGDFGGLIIGTREAVPRDSGPPVTAWVDWWKEDRLYVMETGLLPAMPRLLAKMLGLWSGAEQEAVWSFGVMGYGEQPAQLVLEKGGRLALVGGGSARDPFHVRTVARMRELAEALGGKLILQPTGLAPPGRVTVHPLGGAAMADSPERGVVDVNGEVYGHPGLFVADGSLLPTPIGRAPSMTIAALAEKVVEEMTIGE